ncbi:hypothetical protein DPQ33_05855 [Oceanidesulfovibrio indonesiensis]|uniref:Metal-dependent hydrolase n=1 Tax=Oceanidesulfovibrio indonesiensis TaxID=54767 RepID=A0A7M3MGP8_9BACT|nr:metal-dependent hydrolase [Oceanidesulfovibrio indonesiensis]TVM18277.1 hypothetical protein DPQ33_05855 [Oceanidesulfovibrio indonesiensis]
MPGYKAHLTGGTVLAAGALAGAFFLEIYRPDPFTGAALLATACLAALFPDVDTSSKGRGLFYGILAVVDIALMIMGKWQWAAILGLVAMLPALDNHRGWTHTWWAMLLVPAAILGTAHFALHPPMQILAPFYAAAVVGYFSHLALDREF